MKRTWLNDKPFLTVAAIALFVVTDRVLAWMAGSDGWLATLAGGSAVLAFGLGHCDGMDGPVVMTARRALEAGNVNLVLPWVREQDEAEIREAFAHALAVRKLGPEARELADLHFFETLVRVHRAGEGAPYTGLKPAGRDVGPAVPAADRALDDGSIDQVVGLLTEAVRKGVHRHFHLAMEHKSFAPNDVKAGREYVEAYVPYVHYVERLWEDASRLEPAHHGPGGPEPAAHHH